MAKQPKLKQKSGAFSMASNSIGDPLDSVDASSSPMGMYQKGGMGSPTTFELASAAPMPKPESGPIRQRRPEAWGGGTDYIADLSNPPDLPDTQSPSNTMELAKGLASPLDAVGSYQESSQDPNMPLASLSQASSPLEFPGASGASEPALPLSSPNPYSGERPGSYSYKTPYTEQYMAHSAAGGPSIQRPRGVGRVISTIAPGLAPFFTKGQDEAAEYARRTSQLKAASDAELSRADVIGSQVSQEAYRGLQGEWRGDQNKLRDDENLTKLNEQQQTWTAEGTIRLRDDEPLPGNPGDYIESEVFLRDPTTQQVKRQRIATESPALKAKRKFDQQFVTLSPEQAQAMGQPQLGGKQVYTGGGAFGSMASVHGADVRAEVEKAKAKIAQARNSIAAETNNIRRMAMNSTDQRARTQAIISSRNLLARIAAIKSENSQQLGYLPPGSLDDENTQLDLQAAAVQNQLIELEQGQGLSMGVPPGGQGAMGTGAGAGQPTRKPGGRFGLTPPRRPPIP